MMVMLIIATTRIKTVNMYSSDSQQGEISYPAADIWQCMETFFVVTTWKRGYYWHLVSKARDAAIHHTVSPSTDKKLRYIKFL